MSDPECGEEHALLGHTAPSGAGRAPVATPVRACTGRVLTGMEFLIGVVGFLVVFALTMQSGLGFSPREVGLILILPTPWASPPPQDWRSRSCPSWVGA